MGNSLQAIVVLPRHSRWVFGSSERACDDGTIISFGIEALAALTKRKYNFRFRTTRRGALFQPHVGLWSFGIAPSSCL